jgi:glycosyltransferase involved in cell wall biosynthesis
MRIKWYVSDFHACGYVRGEVIAREVNQYHAPHTIDIKSSVVLSDYYGTDLMVFQRQHDPVILEKMRMAKKMGIPTIYEIDDDFFNTPDEFEGPWKFYSEPKVQEVIKAFLNEVDHVTASTPELKKAIAPYCKSPISVIENALDLSFWEREKPRNEAPIIGWMASGSHMIDAPLVEKPLARLMTERENLKVMTIGLMEFADLPRLGRFKDRVMILPWQDASILPDRMRHMDIGIAPLKGHPYNDSKSGIKALQYWANRTPVVCSVSPAYLGLVEHEKNGMFADDDGQWYRALSQLLDDQDMRDTLGRNGRGTVQLKYDAHHTAGRWVDFFAEMT